LQEGGAPQTQVVVRE